MLHQEQQTDLHRLKKTKEKSKGQQGTSGQQDDNSTSKKRQQGKHSSKIPLPKEVQRENASIMKLIVPYTVVPIHGDNATKISTEKTFSNVATAP